MKVSHKIALALERCHLSGLKADSAYRKIGSGAWHDAYLVYLRDGQRLVVRLRKHLIYGSKRPYDEPTLHEDYAPVSLYYQQANQCQSGICPDVYIYSVAPDLSCTVESYMGPTLSLTHLPLKRAFAVGQHLGVFFRAMHTQPTPLAGAGDLIWRDGQLVAEDQRPVSTIRQTDGDTWQRQFDQLCRSDFHFDRIALRDRLAEAIEYCAFDQEPFCLVNRDTTPENLILKRNRLSGLIDPVPSLHNGHRYAALFIYVYRFLLLALSDAPRYKRHRFAQFAPLMHRIADGFEEGYCQGEAPLIARLANEYFLWAFSSAAEYGLWLQEPFNQEMRLRTGGEIAVHRLVQRSLDALGTAD